MSTIAELLVKIGADNAGLKKTLTDSQSGIQTAFSTDPLKNFNNSLNGTTDGLSGMITKLSGIAALAAGGFGLEKLVSSAVNAGEAVYQLSTTYGLSNQEALEMSRILKITGGDAETVAKSMLRLDKSYTSVGLSGDKCRAVLAATGVSLTDSTGKLLPMNQQLENLAAGYNKALAAGQQEEFLMNTLGSRGLALAETLKDYAEAKEAASRVSGVGLDPQQMHELNIEMKTMSLQASQIGLAFTSAFAPIAQELFPPIMSGLQDTAQFLAQNKTQVVELSKDALELVAAYKSIQLLASAGNAVSSFWQKAAADAAASAGIQSASATALAVAQEAQIARAVAASNKGYTQMTNAAIKSAQAQGVAGEELAILISNTYTEMAAKATAAAEIIQTRMTTAFAEQAVSAQVAGVKTVGALETAKVAAGNFGSSLLALAGGWIGVAVATAFAIDKLFEYLDAKNKVDTYNKKAEVWEDPSRPGKHLVGRTVEGQWVQDSNSEFGGYYMPKHTERVAMTEGEEEDQTNYETWAKQNANRKPWEKPDVPDIDLTGINGMDGGTAANKYANALASANALAATINEKITSQFGSTYDISKTQMDKQVADWQKQMQHMTEAGVDTSGLAALVGQYKTVFTDKITKDYTDAWTDARNQSALINAQLLHDKQSEADAEYAITVAKIQKEYDEEIKRLGKTGNDPKAIAQAEADRKSRLAQAGEVRDYTQQDDTLKQYQQSLQFDSMRVNLEGKTQEQVNAIRQKDLSNYIAILDQEINAAGNNKDRIIQLQQQKNDAINQLYQIDATNMKTAWDVAFKQIRDEQTDYSRIIVGTWDDIKNAIGNTFDKMVTDGMSATDVLRNIFQTVVQDIEKMFLRMWEEQYILGPLQQMIGGMMGGGGGQSVASAVSGGYQQSSALYNSFTNNVPQLHYHDALGGNASGWGIVGEEGPELAYFGNSARVYTAGETVGMLNQAPAASSPNVNVNVINRSGQQVNVSQKASYDPSSHTMLMELFVDGISKNLAGSRDALFGRGS